MPDNATLFHDAVLVEYRHAVATFGDAETAVNKLDMFAKAAECIRMRLHSGELEIPVDDAIHAALSAADSREGRAADGILTKIARGEIGLNLWPDPLLDVVVTLGGGRRKAWKHVTAEDLTDMAAVRTANTKAARSAERRFIKDVASVYAALVTFGSVGAMVESARVAA